MKRESVFKRFLRNIVFAEYTNSDNVPFIGGVQNNMYALSSKVGEIERMSKVGKVFLYFWFGFVVFIMLCFIFLGVVIVLDLQSLQRLGLLGGVFMILLELFVLVQGLSILAYFRWRIKRRFVKR